MRCCADKVGRAGADQSVRRSWSGGFFERPVFRGLRMVRGSGRDGQRGRLQASGVQCHGVGQGARPI
jgi:hypothetical protein